MKLDDNVELTEDMGDLRKGMIGRIVTVVTQLLKEEYPFMVKPQPVLAVKFDTLKYPAVGRRIIVSGKEEYTLVVKKCKVIPR